jgi:hypothetical protein
VIEIAAGRSLGNRLPEGSAGVGSGPVPVRAFVDLSNIWFGIAEASARRGESVLPVRLYAQNLAALLRAGRSGFRQLAVANAEVPASVIGHFAATGEVILRESGRLTGTEQANDETLQVRMYETIHGDPPGVLVLATGDGAGWRQGRGFIPVLDAAQRVGWGVEILAWEDSVNGALVDWARTAGGVFVPLDAHYDAVTFVEAGRRVGPVSLIHRPTAEARANR